MAASNETAAVLGYDQHLVTARETGGKERSSDVLSDLENSPIGKRDTLLWRV